MADDHREAIDYTLPPNKIWLRASEVAAYLDISKSSVFRLINRGEIPSRRFGNSVRILRSDILKFESVGVNQDGGQNGNHA